MNKKKMKQISEAYERIQAIENDIRIIQATAEKVLDKNTVSWLSLDFEDDLLNSMQTQTWTTQTTTGSFFVSSEVKPEEDDGFSMDIPDTVTLEILGVILRYKQQLIQNENNNI
jgi:hypothetical protein